MRSSVHEPIYVQKALSAEVNIGPIPGSQIWSWAGAMIITVVVCNLTNRGWPVGFPLFIWMASTSWILTGTDSWKFLNRFHKPQRYVFAGLRYMPFLDRCHSSRRSNRSRASR